jgi:chaperonin GroEL
MNIRPLHDRIRIKRLGEEEKTKGGIVIPDAAKEKPIQGKVLAVGKGEANDMGEAKTVKIDKDNTIIVGGNGSREAIEARIKQIRFQIEDTTSDYDREKLQERLARLVDGVAVIKVGAPTELEMKEKKARVEDALNATRAAVEEGVVPGGGVVLLRCIAALENVKVYGEEVFGVHVVKPALEEPARQIANNAGHKGSVVVERLKREDGSFGFNAETETYEDLMKAGIIDPTKVTRLAIQNASSIGGLLLTTDVVVTEKPKKKNSAKMP